MSERLNVTVWNEFVHEIKDDEVKAVYPDGIHSVIADFLKKCLAITNVRTATLREPEHGLTDEVLNDTDVMVWWGHMAHQEVSDEIVEKVYNRVMAGMGLIVLHSGHASKIFKRLMGTNTQTLRWRHEGEKERCWMIERSHPITAGVGEYIEIPQSEMYGEYFGIPTPDELLCVSWYEGGEIFRSGCTFKCGFGKLFYFSPGHETFPIYYMPQVQQIITNAVLWAKPVCYPTIVTDFTPEAVNKL